MAREKTAAPRVDAAPDQRKLSVRQAARLSTMTNVSAKELTGLTIAEVSERFKWRIDPQLLFFRRVCGRVVKKDPVTGIEYPVPFATVTVEDTDCNLLAYFPRAWPWGWFYPVHCHREVIATVVTDECGRFCVYIPRFDIDWILRWRRERICFPEIFRRPSIRDLIDPPVIVREPIGPRPGPHPDPGPWEKLARLPIATLEAITGGAGRDLAARVQGLEASHTFGGRVVQEDAALDAPAFDRELPPPLPALLQQVRTGAANVVARKGEDSMDALRSTIASYAGVSAKDLANLDFRRFIGPFIRCIDLIVPEWHLVVDVPDITFRVSQDVDGDGDLETIYSEGYFDVRWNAGAIPDVTLVASPIAKESHVCDTPTVVCQNVPALLFAGLMPLTDPTIMDPGTGYVVRTNRPVPLVPPPSPPAAETPFHGVLQLYGCVNVPGAAFYRVHASLDGGPFVAITGLQWNIYPIPFGPPHTVAADSNGWYPVLPNPNDWHPASMVLEWPTPALGQYTLKIETGNAAKAHLGWSAPVALQVDNTAPTISFTKLAWKFATESDAALALPSRNLLVPCPTIRRGASPQNIEVEFQVVLSANHFRAGSIATSGCGAGSFSLLTDPALTTHWHTTVSDNTVTLHGRYALSSSAAEGSYGFHAEASSRAMNPAGADLGHLLNWEYNPRDVYSTREVDVAVVDG